MMGKYASLQHDVFSVFGGSAWLSENLPTYPQNFAILNTPSEFLRVTIIPAGNSVNRASVKGIVIVDIFVQSGSGPSRVAEIADRLDFHLANKVITTESGKATQFETSTLSAGRLDKDNGALYRTDYTIPFSYFGVI